MAGNMNVRAAETNPPLKAMTYPAEYSRSGKLYLTAGEAVSLMFYFEGDKKKIENPVLVIKTPPFIKLQYIFCPNYWTSTPIQLKASKAIQGNCTTYTISLPTEHFKKNLTGKFTVFDPTVVAAFLEPEPEYNTKSEIQWSVEDGEKTYCRGRMEAVVLAPLKISNPQYFKQYSYDNCLLKAPDIDMLSNIIGLYRKLNISGGLSNSKDVAKHVDKRLEIFSEYSTGFWGRGWWGASAEKMKKYSQDTDIMITLKDGKKSQSPNAICQSWLIENSKYYIKELKANLKKNYFEGYTAGFINDYELDIFSDISWPNCCFCPRCKAAFGKFAGLDDSAIADLSSEKILTEYRTKWIDFRYWQNGEVVKYYNMAVKSLNPSLKTILCSVWISDARDKSYHPIDPREYDDYVDEHWPMLYTQSPDYFDQVARMVKDLKKPVIPCITTCFPVGERNVWLPWLCRLNIIATAAVGGKGVCHFPGVYSMDGEYFKVICDSNRIIAALERFYATGFRNEQGLKVTIMKELTDNVNGKEYEYPSLDAFVKTTLHSIADEKLISIFNYNSENLLYLNISLQEIKDGKYVIYDPLTGIALIKKDTDSTFWSAEDIRHGFSCKLPAGNITALAIKKVSGENAMSFVNVLKEDDIKREYARSIKTAEALKTSAGPAWCIDSLPDKKMTVNGVKIVSNGKTKILEFSGKNAYIQVANSELPVLKGDFTVEFAIFPEKFSATRNTDLISKPGTFNIFHFCSTNVIPTDIINNKDRYWIDNKNFLETGKWNHVAFVYSGGYIRIYHNGNEINQYYTGVFSADASDFPLSLSSKKCPFRGKMANVKIYDKKLNGVQIWLDFLKSQECL